MHLPQITTISSVKQRQWILLTAKGIHQHFISFKTSAIYLVKHYGIRNQPNKVIQYDKTNKEIIKKSNSVSKHKTANHS